MIKRLAVSAVLLLTIDAYSAPRVPSIKFEYSYALDFTCPLKVVPETLTTSQQQLIPKIPFYREQELLKKVSWFQSEWDKQGWPLLNAAANAIGKPFPMRELSAALFLCPRFPSMGTPLSLNVISYLTLPAKDIGAVSGQPMPVFFFVSTTFHEVLHKYINAIMTNKRSAVLESLGTDFNSLYGSHLHVFALQKKVFTDLKLEHLLAAIGQLEATHGVDYSRSWKTVHEDAAIYQSLIEELKN